MRLAKKPAATLTTTRSTSTTTVLRTRTAPAYIAFRGSLEHAIEPIKEFSQQSLARLLRLQQQCRKRRAERERVKRRKQNGDRDAHRELLIELAGNSRNESGGHEYRGENQSDTNYRSGKLLHGSQRRVLRRHSFLDVPFHALDHHDGIVDHEAYGQHQTE